jgi:hypothetical protein
LWSNAGRGRIAAHDSKIGSDMQRPVDLELNSARTADTVIE